MVMTYSFSTRTMSASTIIVINADLF